VGSKFRRIAEYAPIGGLIQNGMGAHHQVVQRCVERALAYGPLAALDDRPRPGKELTITPEAKAWLVSLACDKAKEHGYPFTDSPKRFLRRADAEPMSPTGMVSRARGNGSRSSRWSAADRCFVRPAGIQSTNPKTSTGGRRRGSGRRSDRRRTAWERTPGCRRTPIGNDRWALATRIRGSRKSTAIIPWRRSRDCTAFTGTRCADG
jgi:hypothetical protein